MANESMATHWVRVAALSKVMPSFQIFCLASMYQKPVLNTTKVTPLVALTKAQPIAISTTTSWETVARKAVACWLAMSYQAFISWGLLFWEAVPIKVRN